MDNDEITGELVRLDNGFLVDEDVSYVVSHDDVLEQEENHLSDHNGDRNMFAPLREQDRFLPIANIAKIMKRVIPENGKIAKDARECVQECISEFISFITSEAADRCQVEKRKTINGEDILFALNQLGFDNYVEPLKIYLKRYRELLLNPSNPVNVAGVSKVEKTVFLLDNDANSEGEIDGATVIYTYPKGVAEFIG